MRKFFLFLTALTLLAVPAVADGLTDQQKAEIGPLIREYLLANPEVVKEAMDALERKQADAESMQRTSALSANATDIFHAQGDLVAGNPEGSVTMVEFFDYNCGYCKRAFPDVMKMLQTDKDLRLVMKEFPILGPGSTYAARAALASRKQGKYWDYHLALLSHEGHIDEAVVDEIARTAGLDVDRLKNDMNDADVSAVIEANMKLAQALTIQGTPAFIIDQTLIPGAVGFDALAMTVKQVRDQGGCKLC
ncbi:DsbA family protein [soil metagenome]